jgi:hypothetical protein
MITAVGAMSSHLMPLGFRHRVAQPAATPLNRMDQVRNLPPVMIPCSECLVQVMPIVSIPWKAVRAPPCIVAKELAWREELVQMTPIATTPPILMLSLNVSVPFRVELVNADASAARVVPMVRNGFNATHRLVWKPNVLDPFLV